MFVLNTLLKTIAKQMHTYTKGTQCMVVCGGMGCVSQTVVHLGHHRAPPRKKTCQSQKNYFPLREPEPIHNKEGTVRVGVRTTGEAPGVDTRAATGAPVAAAAVVAVAWPVTALLGYRAFQIELVVWSYTSLMMMYLLDFIFLCLLRICLP